MTSPKESLKICSHISLEWDGDENSGFIHPAPTHVHGPYSAGVPDLSDLRRARGCHSVATKGTRPPGWGH